MAKVVPFILIALVLFAVLAAVNIRSAAAEEDIRIFQISVLSKNQADYGVDENGDTIPAVSEAIIADKAHDIQQQSSVPIIKYTSLPVETRDSTDQDNDNAESVDKSKDKPENKDNANSNPQGGGNQDQNNNGNNNSQQNPGKGNDHKNNGQENEKENKSDKGGDSSNVSDKIK